jgi:8-oxo-dGTP pyrophosphatase MutT (NUDIX family)
VWRELWEEVGLTPDDGLVLVDELKEELKYEIDGGAYKGYEQAQGHALYKRCMHAHTLLVVQAEHVVVPILLGQCRPQQVHAEQRRASRVHRAGVDGA